MLALLLAVCLGPPANAPPPGATDEQVIYESPEPREQPRDVFAPVDISPPVRESVVVEPPPTLAEPPSQPPPPAPLELPPPPPPPSGAGRFVGASFSIGLGLAALSVVAIEGTREQPNQDRVAATFVPLSVAGIGVGTYLLIRAIKARKRFNEWRDYTQARPRPTGEGLLVAGIMSTVVGGVTLVAGAVQARDVPGNAAVPITLSVGAVGVAVGVGTLTWGLLRRSRYRSWRQSTFLSAGGGAWSRPTLLVLPGPTPGHASYGVGWVGRF